MTPTSFLEFPKTITETKKALNFSEHQQSPGELLGYTTIWSVKTLIQTDKTHQVSWDHCVWTVVPAAGGCCNVRIIDYSTHLAHPCLNYNVLATINSLCPTNRGGIAKQWIRFLQAQCEWVIKTWLLRVLLAGLHFNCTCSKAMRYHTRASGLIHYQSTTLLLPIKFFSIPYAHFLHLKYKDVAKWLFQVFYPLGCPFISLICATD